MNTFDAGASNEGRCVSPHRTASGLTKSSRYAALPRNGTSRLCLAGDAARLRHGRCSPSEMKTFRGAKGDFEGFSRTLREIFPEGRFQLFRGKTRDAKTKILLAATRRLCAAERFLAESAPLRKAFASRLTQRCRYGLRSDMKM